MVVSGESGEPDEDERPFVRLERLGRYLVTPAFASGGMGSVHLGRLDGPSRFSRVVAVKRLLPGHSLTSELAATFRDEARLSSRVRHPNVVSVIDMIESPSELALVMEYVHGVPLSTLLAGLSRRGEGMPAPIAASILIDVLRGLGAAHEARDETGNRLDLIHRDVSPQNVLVGVDGHARVVDFGVAKAARKEVVTATGCIKGKLRYAAPEQLQGRPATRQVDLYAAGVVLFELLAGRPFFSEMGDAAIVGRLLHGAAPDLDRELSHVESSVRRIVARALEPDPAARFRTANEMEHALAVATQVAAPSAVTRWVERYGEDELERRAMFLDTVERLGRGEGLIEGTITGGEPVASELIGISPQPEPVTASRRRRRSRSAAIALVGLLTIGLAFALSSKLVSAPAATAAPATTSAEASFPAASAATSHVTSAPATTSSAEEGGELGSRAGAAESETVSPTASPRASGQQTSGRPAHRAGPPARCTAPSFVDSQGRKHYLSSCL